jgi:hypothetical protein
MRIIDFHVHAFADSLAPAAVPALEAAGELTARYDGTVGGLLAAMDRTGVEISVVQPVATKPGQVAAINDWAASIASDRIIAFGAMHPDLPDPGAEMARMRSLGLRGFKMHPEHQSCAPDDPRMGPVFSSAIEQGMIAFFHAGADVIHPTVLGTPDSFERVLDAWPGLTMVLAHLGGFREWQGVSERLAGRDVWLDTAYTPGHLPAEEFVAIVRAHGADRVLFGSDGPWTDAAEEIALLREIGLTAEELEGVLGGNAERLLGL